MNRLARLSFAVAAACGAFAAMCQSASAQPGLTTLTFGAEHSPARAGETISFVPLVGVVPGSGPIEYEFWRLDSDGWHLGQAYSTTSRYQWQTTIADVGEHVVQVWVRRIGVTIDYEDWASTGWFSVVSPSAPPAPPAPRIVSLESSAPPQVGLATTWTATADGGVAPLQYRFLRLDADGWHVAQEYSTANTFTWTPGASDVGAHALQVWVRSEQSTALYEGWLGTGSFIVNGPPPPSVLLAQIGAPPFAAGSAVSWTATASGIAGAVEYRFIRLDAGSWRVVQEYSASRTYTWTPVASDAGPHAIQAWARAVGSAAPYEAWAGSGLFNVSGPPPPFIASFTTNATFPLSAGTGSTVTWTAIAAGVGPIEYRFVRLDGVTWKVVQEYSASNTYTWIPTSGDIGIHAIQVWVRNVGSSAAFEAWSGTGTFAVQGIVTVTVAPASRDPIVAGWSGRWVASATGLADPEYEFWRLDSAGWHLVQPYSSSNTFTWTPGPGEVGIHYIQVRIRSASLGGNAAASATTEAFFVVVVNISSFTVDVPLPAAAGTTITFSATTTAGNQVVEFQFWRWDAAAQGWTLGQDYSATSTYQWKTGVRDIGTHAVQVWVRTVGSPAPYDEWAGTGYFDIPCGAGVTLSEYVDLYAASRPGQPGVALSGSPLTFSAAACGTTDPLEYQFVRTRAGGAAQVVQPYGAASEFLWTPSPSDGGSYTVDVSVRRVGSTAADALASTTFQVKAPGPDLSLTIDTLPFTVAAGEMFTVRDTVQNVGPLTYTGSCHNDYVLNSTPVASRPIPSLATGATDTADTTFIVPSLRPGSYWLFVTTICADLTDTNNRRWVGTRIVF